ncbi:MAG: DEAD/DEAH box helicase [Candidatus Burarchaeum sp.]|nr:DEAD/DEAH box helicase [Candidatus Burarchaeum sp.]MDO8339593.1 DEAD/DEAH box helicase [Candidatus Burarchaeum sp.]
MHESEVPKVQLFIEKSSPAKYGELELAPELKGVLEARGIAKLYKHQADAIELVRQGRNIVIRAPTASGKSEIYLVPLAEASLAGKRSLIIYPTKALSRDQLERFNEFAMLGVRTAVYDGDTPQHEREKVRTRMPHNIITNMDMLHHMLLNERKFVEFWKSLRFVVVDEIHTYSGSFGSHACNVLRRLKRVCAKHRSALQFIFCSATIANAREFAELLGEEKFELVDAESAPKPEINHKILVPEDSYTVASLEETRLLLEKTARNVLVFGNSHNVVERLGILAHEKRVNLKAYRAGLSYETRRELENQFKAGKIRALAATSALELGVDIGNVDAVVLCGFPGTITRVRQRIGRAGRRTGKADAIFVARDSPLDIWYAEHPEKYLRGEPEHCYLNGDNEGALRVHVLAMAKDWPLAEKELASDAQRAVFEQLKKETLLKPFAGHFVPSPAGLKLIREASMRGMGEGVRIYSVDDENKQTYIGDHDRFRAITELFEGAIYLHGGQKYGSEALDLDKGIARVRKLPFETHEYTSALRERDAKVVEELDERRIPRITLHYGRVHIVDAVHGYLVKDYMRDAVVDKHELPEPLVNEFDTYAVWAEFDEEIARGMKEFADGLHAVEHISIAMIPALTGADSAELGGISYPDGTMFIYDGVPMGSGLARVVYENFESILKMAGERLAACTCAKGCPKCILDPQCGNNNYHLSKKGGLEIFSRIE